MIALRRGEAHLAGCHLFHPESETYNIPYLQRYLPDEPVELVTFAQREQGLIVAAGNLLGISSVADLRGARYINRQRGAGTRVLFDHLRAQHHISADEIAGY